VILRRRPPARVVGCGVLAVLLTGGAMIPTLDKAGWSLTAVAHVDSTTKLGAAARMLDPGFRTVHPGAYDGQFYWGIAVDPLATGVLHADFDKPSYRYGHPLYGWLGWLLSADHARAVPAALVAVGLASMFAAATIAAMLGRWRGRVAGWQGLSVALNPGLITAAALDLAEPLAAALLLAALAAHQCSRWTTTWILLALLPLAKEPLLLVLVAVVVWELVQRHLRRAAIFACAAIPALLWWAYSRIRLGAWFTSGDTALGRPLAGWRRALFGGANTSHESVLRHDAVVATLAVLLALLILGAVRARRARSPVDYAYLALAPLAVCLAPNATVELSTALRNTAFLVVLLPFVMASPRLTPSSLGADRRPRRTGLPP
jgi:hypothetical protein